MSISDEYERQIEIIKWINDNLSCSYDLSDRNKQLSLPCFDLAIEHHAAICLLCDSNLYGSMYSLLRVEFEAVVRGLWLYHVATKKQMNEFLSENTNISFGKIIKQIEDKLDISDGVLSSLKSRQWKIFNSFTHTGYQALVRRINDTHTGAVNYKEEDVVSALRHAGLFVVMAAVELSSISGKEDLIESTLNLAREYGD